ncbi:UDP-N-acetylmuramate:L-alanyl-gamma-D-glutamyl-meso-diaminopimelate ligase [Teredinibacter sp. KSP-S5-2]|uniref:UDP-N-acetylmuramate:L-alanyl-gamma-D-glutamyl- meso-diaminopimelate ligase n=1 Tax=Teredinibacter sp. KSP-S5-2 TaxID=3034506 RepID=UPI0029341B7F|nr:UDP-N-acetylmuramate:L-alanyl-gamma-D-glutamyl-meso-diaminopimelate ligase [Teredinibacter sp. KSP-S5-2]WNO09488.1 UDP-N-acetylmuramate:L-alanyl-gamma-D-glutamyl-meso-diaminopimelate ligase [Teredinibacter sp. KSP-S5-2]
MHIHILGVCGTFMGSLAQLAKTMGHKVTGSDLNVYPPMSTQLRNAGIDLIEGFDPAQLEPKPDLVVVGNVISRGNPVMEAVLNKGITYTSGPQWLCDFLLKDKWVMAIAGTHGKTTTTSMLAWILEYAGMKPGFLIGGVPGNFTTSARLGETDFFVIEADEYDTAFFDKRSKFVHYRPRTLVINNLEFDHADIFSNLKAIQTQFHHLMRSIPGDGVVITPRAHSAIQEVIDLGCWSERQTMTTEGEQADWMLTDVADDGSRFQVVFQGETQGEVHWELLGKHNVANGLSAIAAARHVGISPAVACTALSTFKGVKRRLELVGKVGNISVYDDFAHHPTAISTTLQGLRSNVGDKKILAIIEPRSNTMKKGIHKEQLLTAIEDASQTFWFQPSGLNWQLADFVESDVSFVCSSVDDILQKTQAYCRLASDEDVHIVVMSNGGFDGIHQKLIQQLSTANG